MAKISSARIFAAAVIVVLTAGCAGFPSAKSLLVSDVAEKRHRRNEEVIRNYEAHRDQAAYEAALEQWDQNDSKGCREGLEVLLARNPRHIDAQLLMAEVNLLDRRPEDALKQVDKVLHVQPGNARALYTKGLVLDAIGQSTGAVAYYEQAAKAEPENEIYALCYKNAKDSDGPDAANSNAVIPAAYSATSNSNKTVPPSTHEQGPSLTTPAIRQPPVETSSPATPTSETPDKAKKNAGFTDSYAHAESAVSAEELLNEGQRALSDGAIDTARIAFHKAVACQPNNPEIPVVSAGAALRTNHPELAVELLMPAAKHFSKSAAIYRMLGVAYYRLGDFKSSQVALQQALSLDKSSALSYFLMGCTLAKLGQAEPAEAHFQQAKALDPRYTVRR
ncbi:MAG: tetratricopeptide repeat protein [Thermoguttaceae bacterium]|jgi:tetratricopeptide (TPR) repeat protein